ncbi:M48 family metallopeptidase [Pseudalkalibacillus berkeleyi]|uniref:Ankyrin repeat domain-containing protein n=1 Tax=Pseudalkalibacillus berkeleyi TaxID=1069813 RepID=A0ABS9H021_9BACL|nr:ankyrin repeat domain-containing protein [Pseudalkalibacillus berkeleyi]MCF6138279.1 ankyrin repeat domain-containing protein [Pseudalkalibacillus berkeleyi]
MNNQHLQLNELIHKNEKKYFLLVLFISISAYIFLAISIIGILIALLLVGLSLFFHTIMIGQIRTNAVKLSEKQFPLVYQMSKELSERMGIPNVPDIYVMESSGALNAFATRFFGKNMIVLYSEIFDLIEKEANDELNFIIAHELAHIKRNHISKYLFILPAMWIPAVAELYLRACEYTCDRMATFYTGNTQAATNSLTILAIGKTFYKQVNHEAYLEQLKTEKGFFVWLSEMLSTHPPLPKRIHEIQKFFDGKEIIHTHKKTSKNALIVIPSIVLIIGILGVGTYFVAERFQFTSLLSHLEESIGMINEEPPELIDAVVTGDSAKVISLIEKGTDIQLEDSQGLTPLHWAVQDGNEDMVKILINSGADPNVEDFYFGLTPMMSAAEFGNSNIIKMLIEAYGDLNGKDYEGMNALFYAVFSDNPETVKLLIDQGVDLDTLDSENMTALMHAIQLGNRDIINILKKSSNTKKGE